MKNPAALKMQQGFLLLLLHCRNHCAVSVDSILGCHFEIVHRLMEAFGVYFKHRHYALE